jgi:hypothetical protein
MRLPDKIRRATDEACLERARHAIMRVAMHVELSHFGIVETEHHGADSGCRTSEAGSKSSFLGAHDPKQNPQEIPERFGDYPREIPGALGDQSPGIPGSFGNLSGISHAKFFRFGDRLKNAFLIEFLA